MTDLSKLSDEGLRKMYEAYSRQSLAKMPNEQLQALYAQAQPQPQQTAGQMAAEGVGPLQAGLIGAGKATDDLIQGAKQLYYGATGNQPELAALQQQQAEASRHYGPLKQQNPISAGLGETVPTMGAMVATGGSASLLPALLKSGLSAGIPEALKYGTGQERYDRGVIGAAEGVVGAGFGYGLGKLITPASRTAKAPGKEAVDAAERLGIKLTPGQMTGSAPVKRAEQMLANRPGSAGVFAEFNDANTAAINRGAAAAMGETAEAITPDVLAAARSRIGAQFQRLTQGRDVKLGQDFLNALVEVEAHHSALLPALRSSTVPKLIDDALDLAAKGKISGESYQATRSVLTKAASDAFRSNNSALGQSLKGIANALDNAAGQSLTMTEQAAWQQARKQWKALRILETGNVVENGNVSAALLKGQVKKADPVLYREGKSAGPLTDIARYAEGVKSMPSSGTAENLYAMQAMNSPLGFFQTMFGSPLRYMAAKGMLSDKGAQWLGNGKLSSEAKKRLMQGGGLLGVGGYNASQ